MRDEKLAQSGKSTKKAGLEQILWMTDRQNDGRRWRPSYSLQAMNFPHSKCSRDGDLVKSRCHGTGTFSGKVQHLGKSACSMAYEILTCDLACTLALLVPNKSRYNYHGNKHSSNFSRSAPKNGVRGAELRRPATKALSFGSKSSWGQ